VAGDQGGARADSVVQQFEQVVAFRCVHGRDGEVVDDQEIEPSQLRQAPCKAAVAMGHLHFVKQPGCPHVLHGETAACGLMRQGASQPGLAAAGSAGDQQIASVTQPVTGGKNFCAEHQRQGGKRQPARVFHVARIYPDELERLSKTELGLKAAIAKVAQFESERLHMSEASFPEGVTIPEPLIQSASILLIALRRAAPALGPELGGLVDGVWKELVQIASEPYVATGQSSRDDVTLRRLQQEKARRWLTWRTFFEAWWAKSYQGPGSSPQTLSGHGFDIDHPITQGYALAPSGVVVDLLQQRAWTRAEKRVETEAYVSVHLIRKKARSGRSLRSVGKELGVSYETVRKKLLNAKKNGSAKVQRPRARSSFTGQ
jgi:hypothetical protein